MIFSAHIKFTVRIFGNKKIQVFVANFNDGIIFYLNILHS